MDAERWARIQALFHDALERPPAERRAHVERACAGDPDLRDEVLRMLDADAGADPLLDAGLEDAAGRLIGASTALPRERFGSYRAVRFLGEGGMGVVYLGRREDLDAVAALKVLRDASISPARRERFASEQRTLAQLNHPAIAHLFDAGTLPDGTPWIAMEYVEGVPITEHCDRAGASVAERLRLFREVGAAVQHAHGLAIVHRDLKPGNILVTADGAVKLLDFGIAKQLESLEEGADQTRTAFRLMTPAYAAPEQLRGEPVGTYTDVYALGVILYELLTGRRPFDAGAQAHAGAEPEKPSVVARAMALLHAGGRAPAASAAAWADLDVLCAKAMAAEPQRRYASVDAFMRDVDHFLRGEPLDARPDTLGYRLGKHVRRHRVAVVAGAAALLAVVAMTVFYTVRLAAARNAALAEASRTERVQRFMQRLFEGDAEAGPADTLRVMTLIDRGRAEARALGADPTMQADLFETLGGLYMTLGDPTQADTLLRAALDTRRGLHGASHPDVARSLVALAALRVDQSAYDEADSLVRAALALAERVLPEDHPVTGRARVTLGRVLQERGAYDTAIVVLEDAAARFRAAAPGREADPDLAAALYELANTCFYAGQYDRSDSLNRVVMAMHERLYGERHPTLADNLINLGATEQERGRYVESESYFRRGLDITRAWYGRDHVKTATNLTMLGRSLVFQDRLDEGRGALEEALDILERVYGDTHPRVASALNELGTIALRRGRYDEAERAYRRMLAINRRVFGEGNYQIAVALSNLSTVALRREDYREAERLAREAVAVYAAAQGPRHLNTGLARLKLGRALLRQSRFGEAVGETRAGYEIVEPLLDPSSGWLSAARSDLVEAYAGLGDAAEVARWRAAGGATAGSGGG